MGRKLTIGPKPYKVRVGHNLDQWKLVAEGIRFDPEVAMLAVEEEHLARQGVERAFIVYALRNGYLQTILRH